jgi:catalase-peroxidase
MGWHFEGSGNAEHTMTNGIEGSWTPNPTQWTTASREPVRWLGADHSPAGASQWTPVGDMRPRRRMRISRAR